MIGKMLALATAFMAVTTSPHAESLEQTQGYYTPESFQVSSDQFECLALNVYFEARNQSHAGKIGVSMVVLNRVDDLRYPDTICGVVKQAKLNSNGSIRRNQCQFSWYCDGLSDHIRNREAWFEARHIAIESLRLWSADIDITDGSTHYHAKTVQPRWASSLTYVTTLDDHHFYRWD